MLSRKAYKIATHPRHREYRGDESSLKSDLETSDLVILTSFKICPCTKELTPVYEVKSRNQ